MNTDRAQLASLNATPPAPEISLEDALWRVEQELQRRGEVAPEQVIPRLMEAGLPCQWVKDRPPGQRAYAGHNPDLRTLQDAIHRAGAVPYIRLDDGGYSEDDPPASLHLGWEVVQSEARTIINALHGFVLSPGPHTFDVLIGYLHGSRVDIIGGGPVASWCRARRLQK